MATSSITKQFVVKDLQAFDRLMAAIDNKNRASPKHIKLTIDPVRCACYLCASAVQIAISNRTGKEEIIRGLVIEDFTRQTIDPTFHKGNLFV